MKLLAPVSLMAIALFAFVLIGCGTEPSPNTTPTADTGHGDDEHGDDEHGDHDHGDHKDGGKSDMEKMEIELAKFTPEDAASAKKQHMCPVTDEMLGSMGAPIKVDVDGKTVWICCKGCKGKLLKNPEKYLAKLNKE